MAAGSYPTIMHELDDDDVIHRLLPRDLLEDDIGIVDSRDIRRLLPRDLLEEIGIVDPAEQQVLDVVDGLAAHLVSVLGGGGAPKKVSSRHPQVKVRRGLGGLDVLAGGGGGSSVRAVAVPPSMPTSAVPWPAMKGLRRDNVVLHPAAATMPPVFTPARSLAGGGSNVRAVVVPPSMPTSAVSWPAMEGLRRDNMVLHPAAATMPPAFTPARPPLAGGAQPTTVRRGGAGTGVFLPRTEVVVCRAAKAARSPGNGNQARVIVHPLGLQRASVLMVKTPQEMRAVAAHMERRYYPCVHYSHPELALQQKWPC